MIDPIESSGPFGSSNGRSPIGARSKNHPNYFTDVRKLVQNAALFGFRIDVQRYYARRGDFADGHGSESMLERFYEFLLVLNKTAACQVTETFAISAPVSRTHARQGSGA